MPSKIEWCDETINPLGWGCYGPGGTAENPKPCSYCYARRMAARGLRKCGLCNQFIPHTHLEQLLLLNKWKKPKKIFIESMGDLFHDAIPDEWIEKVFEACKKADHHKYLFLTKNPKKYRIIMRSTLDFREYMWFGTTVNTQKDLTKHSVDIMNLPGNLFLSVEPIHGWIDLTRIETPNGDGFWNSLTGEVAVPFSITKRAKISWVIIGAETGQNKNKIIPKREWIEDIVNQCKTAGVPVFLKNSLKSLMGDNFIQEWPEEMNTFNK